MRKGPKTRGVRNQQAQHREIWLVIESIKRIQRGCFLTRRAAHTAVHEGLERTYLAGKHLSGFHATSNHPGESTNLACCNLGSPPSTSSPYLSKGKSHHCDNTGDSQHHWLCWMVFEDQRKVLPEAWVRMFTMQQKQLASAQALVPQPRTHVMKSTAAPALQAC